MEKLIKDLKELKEVQRNNITSQYMLGLYNGIELSLAIAENRKPEYLSNTDIEVTDNLDSCDKTPEEYKKGEI
jgi:hypothetical protein